MSSTTEARVAVITGGSSGIGLHAARALRGRGLNVYELSRRAENAEPGVTHLQADVTDEAQVNAGCAAVASASTPASPTPARSATAPSTPRTSTAAICGRWSIP